MSKARQLAFCLLVLAAVIVFTAPATAAKPSFSYTTAGFAPTMGQACLLAIQAIEEDCRAHGPITTETISCPPFPGPGGQICKCEATTTYCLRRINF